MELTAKDKECVLELCGTEGNIEKGILFLQMMYDCSHEDGQIAIDKLRGEVLERRKQ